MSKLNYLIGVSLGRKVKTKWFLFVNILLCIVVSLLINVDSLIMMFGGDFNETKNIYVIDNSGYFSESFDKNFDIVMEQNLEGQFTIMMLLLLMKI